MDHELFRAGVDQTVVGGIADTIGFHVLGEPLLYPNILDAVGYAHHRGLHTVLTTNGSLLTPEMVQGLARAKLGVLIISLQMLGAEAHQCREARLSYEDYYGRVLDAVGQICQSAH
jgi:MoaA/NifB/PqqE/SkfB family radical SAM enzyme